MSELHAMLSRWHADYRKLDGLGVRDLTSDEAEVRARAALRLEDACRGLGDLIAVNAGQPTTKWR